MVVKLTQKKNDTKKAGEKCLWFENVRKYHISKMSWIGFCGNALHHKCPAIAEELLEIR